MPNHALNLLDIHIVILNRHTPSTEKKLNRRNSRFPYLRCVFFFLIQCKPRLILEQYPVYVSTQWYMRGTRKFRRVWGCKGDLTTFFSYMYQRISKRAVLTSLENQLDQGVQLLLEWDPYQYSKETLSNV